MSTYVDKCGDFRQVYSVMEGPFTRFQGVKKKEKKT